jgi:metallo-beta-lactamase class B
MTRRAPILTALCAALLAALSTSTARTQGNDWMEPFPAFTIAGNLHYVGSKGLASYLVTTPEGHILVNSSLTTSVPLIRKSVESLGFRWTDVRVLLISHAHWDHDAGSAEIVKQTGAKYFVMDADVPVVESGGKADFQYGSTPDALYPPAKVDRALKDGDEVRLGGAVLVAHLTPGHTKGCTTWTLQVQDGGRTYDAVIVGSPNVNPGYTLVGDPAYPRMADDFARTFRVLESLRCDLFLGAHGAYFDMEAKYPQARSRGVAAFVDPAGYKAYVADRKAAFEAELAKQKTALGNR